MNRFKYALFIAVLIISSFNLYASSIEIIVKLHNEIITNIDIENEKKYLIFLNPKLKQLENKTINKIAKDSLIKEIIKKKEIRKFYDMEVNNDFVESIEKNFFKNNNVKDKTEFKSGYLILKLNDKREINEVVDVEKQIEELINKERNRQLNAFSNIYYKKLKKNILINEF